MAGSVMQTDRIDATLGRTQTGYEHVGTDSKEEADEMYELAQRLRSDVVRWLLEKHPALP